MLLLEGVFEYESNVLFLEVFMRIALFLKEFFRMYLMLFFFKVLFRMYLMLFFFKVFLRMYLMLFFLKVF